MAGIRREREGPLAVLRLDKSRGNAIDEGLVGELRQACADLEADDSVRGVLLASAHPKLFCPGLDLVSLVEYDRARLQRFMSAFGLMLSALYGLRKPVVAAVSGHAVAGGCILAMAADWRVLRRGGVTIGLNEVKVGVPLPLSVTTLLRATVPPGSLSRWHSSAGTSPTRRRSPPASPTSSRTGKVSRGRASHACRSSRRRVPTRSP